MRVWREGIPRGRPKSKSNDKSKCGGFFASLRMTTKNNGNSKDQGKDKSKSWRVECIHSHLSDDKAVAKMGHPFVRGERGRTDNSYGKEQAQRQRESDCNGEWVLDLR
jgi:hypothetical protein